MEPIGVNTETIGISPDTNAAAIADAVNVEQETRAIKRDASVKKLKQATDIVRSVVNENANPSPVLIAAVFAGVMIAVWIIYAMLIKPDASGEWFDDRNGKWELKHGIFGSLCATYNGRTLQCTMSDNMFKCGNVLGIWNYADIIILVGGGNLTRVR
jgi:hypothetical protein